MNSIQHWVQIPRICAVDDTQLTCEATNKDWCQYVYGLERPNYQVPATIGFMYTKHGTYLFDTRDRFDGMPLFRGYTHEQWKQS